MRARRLSGFAAISPFSDPSSEALRYYARKGKKGKPEIEDGEAGRDCGAVQDAGENLAVVGGELAARDVDARESSALEGCDVPVHVEL